MLCGISLITSINVLFSVAYVEKKTCGWAFNGCAHSSREVQFNSVIQPTGLNAKVARSRSANSVKRKKKKKNEDENINN